MNDHSTRRSFLKNSAALGTAALSTAWWVGETFAEPKETTSKMQKVNIACIGVGGKGDGDSSDAGRLANVVALCDVDDLTLEKKGKLFPRAKRFNDYREMIDTMGDKFDAVTVSVPDHSHASASIMAMKKGKHCFTQKPLAWSVYEARRMREVAAEMKVATQMGNQGTSESGFRTAVEVIRSGTIGNVSEVHVWTNRPIWPQGTGRFPDIQPIPKHLHWDLFLGPAPERPYHADYTPFKWRGWLDWGTGALGDMACHTANMAVMSLDLFEPTLIEVKKTSGIVANETYPANSVIEFHFPERGKLPPCSLTWYDGQNYPPAALLQGEKRSDSGSLLVGSEGMLYSPNDYGADYKLLPKEKFKDFKRPEKSLPRSPGHVTEWLRACQGGKPAMSNFDYAGRLTETILLGNLALRAGKPIEWDAKNLKVTNVPEANQFVQRKYRYGYSI